jgi:predicted house-cleaning NTP pyrophosphatase (Maf/HAM1 superfamily)
VFFSRKNVRGKPVDGEDALRMLPALSGRKHGIVTGIRVEIGEIRRVREVESKLAFKELFEADSRAPVSTQLSSGARPGSARHEGPRGVSSFRT